VPHRSMDSQGLLSGLRAAHCEVLKCIAELESVTGETKPDASRYTAARFRISRASLERRSLWQRARRHLQSKVTAADAEQIRLLASIDSDLGRFTADHVGRWTVAAIQSDWTGYRDASRSMRQRMSECIKAEKQILYPLLARYA
jgi:hypothetical protein